MKYSKYNVSIPSGNKLFVYNAKSDYFVLLEDQLARIYNTHINNIPSLEAIAPEFYSHLIEHGIIVEDDFDELQDILSCWEKEDICKDVLRITINPTLNCNLRCWYCYEEHKNKNSMSEIVRSSIVLYIKNAVQTKKYKQINISFFGGEPLLCFDSVIKPLIEDTRQAIPAEINIQLHITTNSTLLNDEIVDYLERWSTSFQITIDGNEFIHNITKKLKENSAYKIALSNIAKLLERGLKVGIRFNYTAKTLITFYDVLSDLKLLSLECKRKCNVSFHRIWQDDKVPYSQIESDLNKLENKFREENFYVIGHSTNITGRCYADKQNSIVINYDGKVYMCTARDFNEESCEGALGNDGRITFNEKYSQRMAIRFGNEKCKSCIIYPICHGGCSQKKLEFNSKNDCFLNYTESDKIEFVTKRILDIYNEQKEFNNHSNIKIQ